MNALRDYGQWTHSLFVRYLRKLNAHRVPLGGRFKFGIALRLTVAFVGVALLAAAANLIVEHAVLVVRTTEIRHDFSPVVPSPPPPAPVYASPLVRSSELSATAEKEALLLAINRFAEDVRGRIEANSTGTAAQLHRSDVDLNLTAAAYIRAAGQISARLATSLKASISTFRQHGDELIALGDDRRALLNEYSSHLEEMQALIKGSLDHAWKIFGRVVARESLVQLNTNINEVRRAFTALNSGNDEGALSATPQVDSEQTVRELLIRDKKTFLNSEGLPWYARMLDGVTRLIELRASLIEKGLAAHDGLERVAAEAEKIAALLPKGSDRVIPQLPPAAVAGAGQAATPEPKSLSEPLTLAKSDAVKVTTHSVTTGASQARSKRLEMAWISGGVLALLMIICVGTVLSIVRPVRRLLDASARLARGEREVLVPRGGIKELDTLAAAFNDMAERLALSTAANHAYQQRLESRVEERTLQLQKLAQEDPLTGLPNRRQLFVLLNAAMQRAQPNRHRVGVFFLDIDNFKYINDSMGHAFGDRLLISLSNRLDQVARAFGFAARLGGDEFTLIFENAESVQAIADAAALVVHAFHKPLLVDGRELVVSISLGVSIYPDHESDADALLSAADAALFRAKALGRSQLAIFTPELLASAKAKFTTEQGLRRALERGEFELVFQPEVSAETLETSLVEALIRWRVPDGQSVGPQEFLAVAEESGLIMEIGDWVLRTAIEATSRWYHGVWPEARVAINVSPRQLFDPGFVDRVQELLLMYRLPARAIEIELTETVLQTGRATIETLKRLRAHGVAIALDDFGSGYSSLTSLEQLPLTRIKLDRGLIAGVDTSPRSAAIARAIIGMCQGLGLEVTAEGIERLAQFEMLLGYRSMYLQGHLLACPVSGDELIPVMAQLAQRSQELLLNSRSGILASNSLELPAPPPLRLPQTG